MNELTKKPNKGKNLTVEDYIHVTQVMLEQQVGLYNYFDTKLKENKEELKQTKEKLRNFPYCCLYGLSYR